MDAIWSKEMLLFLLPVVGKGLKAIPFVSNKLIPFVLAILAIAKNYWVLAGFPMETGPLVDPMSAAGGGLHLAGVLGALGGIGTHALAIGWGIAESWLSQQIYRSAKYKTAWEQAKSKGLVSETQIKPHWLV